MAGEITVEDTPLFGGRALEHVWPASLQPVGDAKPVCDKGFMSIRRTLMVEIVPRTAKAGLRDGFHRQRFVGDLDAVGAAQALPDHVTVDDQAFKAKAAERSVHAGRLIDQRRA